MRKDIPNEILHYTERDDYKEWKQRKRALFFENFIFAILLITIIALSFYSGRLIERHFAISDSIKTHYQQKKTAEFIKI